VGQLNLPICVRIPRITSRPWQADAYLKSTIATLILGKGSCCMKIEHSEVFKAIFARFVKRMRSENDLHPASVSARSVRNLRACKVRFDSCTKPMGRFILYLPAVISTLIEVMTTRAGSKSGHTATEHLQFIDSERVIAVSMLADAGDEALMLARFLTRAPTILAKH
jgi:hypothetical protein